jgi:integrative and conjugative element protein (TIGR02256 family)
MIVYPVGRSSQCLILETPVLEHFRVYQQRRWYQKESGGQLFARIAGDAIRVAEATGPRKTDKRSRFSFVADRRAEQREIRGRYADGLHYVGDWHTHPERIPTPSGLDLESIRECVRRSTHRLNAFVLVVVGNADFPEGLHVSIHDGTHTETIAVLNELNVSTTDGTEQGDRRDRHLTRRDDSTSL